MNQIIISIFLSILLSKFGEFKIEFRKLVRNNRDNQLKNMRFKSGVKQSDSSIKEIEVMIQNQQMAMFTSNSSMSQSLQNQGDPNHMLSVRDSRCYPAIVNMEEKFVCYNNSHNKDYYYHNSSNFDDHGEIPVTDIDQENAREEYIKDIMDKTDIINAIIA